MTSGKVMPLGEHLGADQDTRRAILGARQLSRQGALAARRIPVDAHRLHAGKPLRQKLFDALRTLTQGAQIGAAAVVALGRQGALMAAMVATQAARALVQGHMGIAARTIGQPTAFVANQGGREPAPVEKQQHLTIVRQVSLHHAQQGRREGAVHGLAAQVQQDHTRRLGTTGPLRQRQASVTTLLHVKQGFQRRRGGTQQHRHLAVVGAPHGQVAGGIAKPVLLLERGVVFFVDNDQAQARQRREHRGAGADDHGGRAGRRLLPGTQTLAVIKAGMEQRQRLAETASKRATSCGVRPISGTSTRTWRPWPDSARSIAGRPRSCRCR